MKEYLTYSGRIRFVGDVKLLRKFGTAVILCGGKSSRMGFDKSLVKVRGKFLIEIMGEKLGKIFDNIVLVSNDLEKIRGFDFKYKGVIDIMPGLGPAGAIYTALKASDSRYVFVTACDMPVVKLDYIRYMMEIAESEEPDGVMSRSSTFIEPLYAFYSVGMAGTFESEIKKNNLRLFDVISRSNIHFVDYSKVKEYCRDADIFTNLNYRTDLDALEKIYMEDRVPVVSIVSAISGAGKTTLITGIIKNLKSRNYKVGILKHDVKKFEIDYPGKDSYKFTEAGADNVIIASPSKLAMIQNLQNKKSIEEMLWLFRDEDIVIVEGFKNNRYPKIEIHRKEAGSALLCKSPEHSHTDFIAVASDEDLDMDIPVLNIDDSVEISDFIEKLFLKGRGEQDSDGES